MDHHSGNFRRPQGKGGEIKVGNGEKGTFLRGEGDVLKKVNNFPLTLFPIAYTPSPGSDHRDVLHCFHLSIRPNSLQHISHAGR